METSATVSRVPVNRASRLAPASLRSAGIDASETTNTFVLNFLVEGIFPLDSIEQFLSM